MKKIALVNQYGTIPGEPGYSRTHYIGKYLSEAGFKVDFICGSFNHWSKQQKDKTLYQTSVLPYRTYLLHQSSYNKNVSIKRLLSQYLFAYSLKKQLWNNRERYDLVLNILPPSDAGIISAKYCKKNNIPFVIDLNDLWPEAMAMIINNKLLRKIVTYPIKQKTNKVYSAVNGIIGTSDTYRDRPLKVNKNNIPKITVYVGTDIALFDIATSKNTIKKPDMEFWITYAGTLGTSYDIHTLMKAGRILKDRGYHNMKFIIIGDGPSRKDFENTAQKANCNVFFTGYMEYSKMVMYLKVSDILINSFVKKAPQSIVNKIGDYLSAGKPIINTCSDKEFQDLVINKGFGVNVIPENEIELANAIEHLYNLRDQSIGYAQNARATAEKYFDRKIAYQEIVKLISVLIYNK